MSFDPAALGIGDRFVLDRIAADLVRRDRANDGILARLFEAKNLVWSENAVGWITFSRTDTGETVHEVIGAAKYLRAATMARLADDEEYTQHRFAQRCRELKDAGR